MTSVAALHRSIVEQLRAAGRRSGYRADADEKDPRYRSYGARAADKAGVVREHRAAIKALGPDEKLDLANRLIESGYGEQQDVALSVLEQLDLGPTDMDMIDGFVRRLHGWSKIDAYAGTILKHLLERHPEAVIAKVREWNRDPDLWLRRASVVVFTRKVAASGRFNDVALELCDTLARDDEDMVRKGVGWALKDLMRSDKPRIVAYVKELRAAGVSSVITNYAIRELKGAERRDVLAVKPGRRGDD